MQEEADRRSFDFDTFASLSIATGFQYFKSMEKVLSYDTSRCLAECNALKKNDDLTQPLSQEKYFESGFWHRSLARSLLTYVEGILFVMRLLIIYAEDRGEIKLAPAEAALVREVEYRFHVGRKKIDTLSRPNRFLENFVLTFRLFPQVFGSAFEVDYSSHGWEKMQQLVKLRNSMTHPKSVTDGLLDPELPNVIRDAATWFFGCMRELVSSFDVSRLEKSMKETVAMPEMSRMLEEKSRGKSNSGG